MSVDARMRHTRANRCAICGGADGDPRGKERRCHGWTTEDGEWVHCTREELAGRIDVGPDGCYAHRMRGPCRCGTTHGVANDTREREEPEETYDYLDERGAMLFQVVRFPGKKFRQRRQEGGQWLWQTSGVRRVLYRTPELMRADVGRRVWIAEGEKDVHALERAGEVATTNPGGAGKWSFVSGQATKVLRGREVIVFADADQIGRDHAATIATSLHGIASSVRVVEAVVPHKDAADYLSAGGKLDDLLGPPKAPEISASWNVIDMETLAEPLPPVPWICEALGLAPGAVTLVAGYGYSRKTMALQSLGLSVASGRPIWGTFRSARGAFVHLDYEQGRRLTQERYQRLAKGMGVELASLSANSLRVACMPRLYLDEKDISEELLPLVDGASVVLVDSLRAAFPHADENSSEVRSYLDVLSRVSERTGAMFAVIHHARKPQPDSPGGPTFVIRGSSALFDACQSVYVFEGEKNTPTTVHHQKDRIRGACAEPFGLDSEDIPRGEDRRWGLRVVHLEPEQMAEAASAREDDQVEQTITAIESALRRIGGVHRGNKRDLLGLAGVGHRTNGYRALQEATSSGRIVNAGTYREPAWRLGSC